MDPILDFTNKTILITGASSGFGKQLSKEVVDRGAKVVLGDIDMDGLNEHLAELGDNAVGQYCNVASEEDCASLAALADEKFGSLNIAVNNAGVGHGMALIAELSEPVLQKQFDVNVKSVAFGMKYQIPLIIKQGGGSILNVASMAGLLAAPQMGAYAAAKHAVVGLTRTAAFEYGRANIRVNAMCPYFTPTNIGDGFLKDEENAKNLSRGCPMKRIARLDEIITAMLFAISPANSYMNGQTLAIDGGVSAI